MSIEVNEIEPPKPQIGEPVTAIPNHRKLIERAVDKGIAKLMTLIASEHVHKKIKQ